jgi:hypothetical protein
LIKGYVTSAGASATGRLDAAAITTAVPPGAPAAVASFSSRGPSGGAGGDVLKPDVSAPGVSVMAGVAPPGNGGALYALYQGTSMATPHVAGLAALLKQLHPDWSPMMIKSALMTTATQMSGAANQAPFNAGAGLANANAATDPGLVYDSSAADWLAFVCGTGEIPVANCAAAGITPITPTDLNAPSIAVARATDLPYTVTRRVTNVGQLVATYNATIVAPAGFTTTVNPTSLLIAPGETKSFTVTFTRTNAPFDTYRFGSLTWDDGVHTVRIPIAVRAVQIITTSAITGSGASGSIGFNAFFGYTGDYTPVAHGLVADTRLTGTVNDDPNNSFDTANPNGEPGATAHDIVVPANTRYVRFALFDEFTDKPGNHDLDLVIYFVQGSNLILLGGTGGATSNETASIINPTAGTYRVFVHGFETDGPSAAYSLFYWNVPEASSNMTVTGPATVIAGDNHTITVEWSGLTPGLKYLGTVTHHRLPAPVAPGALRIAHTSVFIDVPAATTAVPDE